MSTLNIEIKGAPENVCMAIFNLSIRYFRGLVQLTPKEEYEQKSVLLLVFIVPCSQLLSFILVISLYFILYV